MGNVQIVYMQKVSKNVSLYVQEISLSVRCYWCFLYNTILSLQDSSELEMNNKILDL